MTTMRSFLILLLLALFATLLFAEQRNDPLNEEEINQLRVTAQEPLKRLPLFVDFARARLDKVQQAHSDPKLADREHELHERLQDFMDVYDELNDNIDTYADRNDDIHKALKVVIDADTEFDAKLRALQTPEATGPDARQYAFLLQTAQETVESSAQDHRQLLAEQEEAAKRKKDEKKQKH